MRTSAPESAGWTDGSADGAPGGFQAAVPLLEWGNDVRLHWLTKSPLDRFTFSLRPNPARVVVDLVEIVQRRVVRRTWNDVEPI